MVSGPPVLRMGASAWSVIVFRDMAVRTARPKRIDLFIGFKLFDVSSYSPPDRQQNFYVDGNFRITKIIWDDRLLGRGVGPEDNCATASEVRIS